MKRYEVPKCIARVAFVTVIIAQCVPGSSAEGQLAHKLSIHPTPPAFLNSLFVPGDLDGDQRPDQAELHVAGSHRCIRVRFGNFRESHLDFRNSPQSCGTLLTRDVNHDNKADLVWVSRFQSELAVVWLGDGFGHFAEAAYKSADGGLRALLYGDPDRGMVGAVKDEQVFLTPDPVSSELARPASVEPDPSNAVLIAGGDNRRDLGLYLSYLRERGPPVHTPFV